MLLDLYKLIMKFPVKNRAIKVINNLSIDSIARHACRFPSCFLTGKREKTFTTLHVGDSICYNTNKAAHRVLVERGTIQSDNYS